MKCQIENCVRNSHGYCDGSLYVHIDQNGLCDNMELQQPTNAQKIRAMSEEELAAHIWPKFGCPDRKNNVTCGYVGNCKDCWLDWLQQPAEEDT